MNKKLIAKRLKEARERIGLKQQEVANLLGWKSHASIVAIEKGEQDIKTWELLKLAQILKVSPESLYQEEPYEASEHPIILWRQRSTDPKAVLQEECYVMQLCQDYRLIERLAETSASNIKPLPFENCEIESVDMDWANQLADKMHRELCLGDYPAELLAKRLEEDYGVLLISRSLENGSAACCRGELGDAIVLHDKDVPWRQVFSLAHELFHLITWNTTLIKKVCSNRSLFQKNERLADAFAAALLIPHQMIDFDIRGNKLTYSLIVALARKYRVSTETLLRRLSYLRFLPDSAAQTVLADNSFVQLDKATFKEAFQSAPSYGGRFLRLAYLAFEKGRLSKSRLGHMLHIKLRDIDSYLSEKGYCLTDDKEIEAHSS